MKWYYVDEGGNQCGPFSSDELKAATAGVQDYYVFREGFADWCLASQTPELTGPPPATPPPLPRLDWYSAPITQAQKDKLILYGVEAHEGMTNGEASDVIERLKNSGVKPDKGNLARHKEKLEAAYLADSMRKLMEVITRLQSRDIEYSELDRVRIMIESLLEEVLYACDKRIEKLIKEGEKAVHSEDVNGFMSLFGKDGDWAELYKKPTRKQVEEVMKELDRIKPEGHQSEMDFINCLEVKFPGLRK